MRLPEWFPGVRAHRAHIAVWAPELERDAEGFTRFARLAEAAIVARLVVLGLDVASRQVRADEGPDGEPACWVELALSGSPVRVYVYDDQVDVIGGGVDARVEQWDAETPEAGRAAALAVLDRALAGGREPAV